MTEWIVAILFAAISGSLLVYILCRLLGVGAWLKAWLTSPKEETVQLTKSAHYEANGYKMASESELTLDTSGAYKHYDNVASDMRLFQEVLCPHPANLLMPKLDTCLVQDQLKQSTSAPGTRDVCQDNLSEALFSSSESCPVLQRALSADSLCSVSSIVPDCLRSPQQVGQLEIGLEYDEETEDLMVLINRGKDIAGVPGMQSSPDTYIRVFLLPERSTNMQTRMQRKSTCPEYKERFLFGVDQQEVSQRTVSCHVYASDRYSQHLVGEANLKLVDVDLSKPYVGWLSLVDPNQVPADFGDILFSLSYSPTAERLTVVIVKVRNLKFTSSELSVGDSFVKVYLVKEGKKLAKKKTSIKKDERNPIFNEAMIFSVPVNALHTTFLRVSVSELLPQGKVVSLGHVITGSKSSGKSLSHWNQMMNSLRKPVAMWHSLRKSI